jgi:DNA-binding response OmpR family regulator
MKTKILIVEDDPAIRMGLEDSLTEENYSIESSADGNDGYNKALNGNFDLLILDLMLPSKNGYDITRELRRNDILTPIIMLTSKKEEVDKVLGFETGADDYITKPFSIAELKMRIKAVLRRINSTNDNVNHNNSHQHLEEFEFGNIKVKINEHLVTKDDKPVDLNVKEMSILTYFYENAGKVITRDDLLDKIWGYESFPNTRTVDNYILSLRKKIEDDPSDPKHIQTIHSLGYKFLK